LDQYRLIHDTESTEGRGGKGEVEVWTNLSMLWWCVKPINGASETVVCAASTTTGGKLKIGKMQGQRRWREGEIEKDVLSVERKMRGGGEGKKGGRGSCPL